MPRRKRVVARPSVGHETAYELVSRRIKRISGPASPPPIKVERPTAQWKWTPRRQLVLYIGKRPIARWPAKDRDNMFLAMVESKIFVNKDTLELSTDQSKVLSLAKKLRQALLTVEAGGRQKAVYRMRRRLERLYLNPPSINHSMIGEVQHAREARSAKLMKARKRIRQRELKLLAAS